MYMYIHLIQLCNHAVFLQYEICISMFSKQNMLNSPYAYLNTIFYPCRGHIACTISRFRVKQKALLVKSITFNEIVGLAPKNQKN